MEYVLFTMVNKVLSFQAMDFACIIVLYNFTQEEPWAKKMKLSSFPRHARHEVLLHLDRVGLIGQVHAESQPLHVGVDYDAFRFAEHVPQDDVCSFPPDSGQLDQLLHGIGDHSAVRSGQLLAAIDDALRLRPEKSGGPDDLFELGLPCIRVFDG